MNESTPYWGSDEDFRIVSEAGVERMRVTAHASTTVTNRVAGRVVIASDGVFTDNGTILSPLGGGGGVSDPLTVGPVRLGTGANGVNNSGIVIGAGGAQAGPEVTIFTPGTTTPAVRAGNVASNAAVLAGDSATDFAEIVRSATGGAIDAQASGSGAYAYVYMTADRIPGTALSGNASFGIQGDNGSGINAGAAANGQSFLQLDGTAGSYVQMQQGAPPTAPAVGRGIFGFRDNGAGKAQMYVRFNTGAIQILATEP